MPSTIYSSTARVRLCSSSLLHRYSNKAVCASNLALVTLYNDDSHYSQAPTLPFPGESRGESGLPTGSYIMSPNQFPRYPLSLPSDGSLLHSNTPEYVPLAQAYDHFADKMQPASTPVSNPHIDHNQQQQHALGSERTSTRVHSPTHASAPPMQQKKMPSPHSRYVPAHPQSTPTSAAQTHKPYVAATSSLPTIQTMQSPQNLTLPISLDQYSTSPGASPRPDQGGSNPKSTLTTRTRCYSSIKRRYHPQLHRSPSPYRGHSLPQGPSPSRRKEAPSPTRHIDSGSAGADGMIYRVRFKRASRAFLLHASAPETLAKVILFE